MQTLSRSLNAWQQQNFTQVLKAELEALGADALLLTRATQHGGYVEEQDIQVGVLNVAESERFLNIKLSVFFSEIVINCGCGDDPYSVNNYVERLLQLDKRDGSFQIITVD